MSSFVKKFSKSACCCFQRPDNNIKDSIENTKIFLFNIVLDSFWVIFL